MTDVEVGAYCRSNGIYASELNAWKVNCMNANNSKKESLENELMRLRSEVKQLKAKDIKQSAELKSKDKELDRMKDAIADFGPERLFLRCSEVVATKLELNPVSVHIDSTSFHYEGKTRVEDGCDIVVDKGYSRDSHPELNQINELMICDELSHIPLFEKCVSGHTSDKTSFKDVIITYWSLIKEQFKDLRYLVADSALCTSDNAKELALHHLYTVTRIPDSYG